MVGRGLIQKHFSKTFVKISAVTLWLLRRRFFNKFSKIYPLCCHGHQSNSAIWTNNSEEKYLNICSETAKNATFHFSHYKSKETISCHSNQSSYAIGTKNTIIHPPAPPTPPPPPPPIYRCYMWNMERIGFTASGEVVWKCWRTDGRQTDGRRMSTYTISSHMSLRLRWANNQICVVLWTYEIAKYRGKFSNGQWILLRRFKLIWQWLLLYLTWISHVKPP